jgi:hypothetical protein
VSSDEQALASFDHSVGLQLYATSGAHSLNPSTTVVAHGNSSNRGDSDRDSHGFLGFPGNDQASAGYD